MISNFFDKHAEPPPPPLIQSTQYVVLVDGAGLLFSQRFGSIALVPPYITFASALNLSDPI